jgi:tagatose 1,6-diphosphate aldolase GatY/KbaY
MTIASAKEILLEAAEGKYAVGAFNITNFVQMEAIVEAAVDKNAPLIIQTSVTPSKFLGRDVVVAVYRALAESAPIPIALNLDHCREVPYCKECADAGYTSLMMDASREAFETNIEQTRAVCNYAHQAGNISVEGELGTVSGVEDQIAVAEDEAQLCNADQAVEFVKKTGVDLLAPAIGTAHGIYKTKDPKVDVERLTRINQILNGKGAKVPLVIHGGTGLPAATVERLIAAGGTKFNVSTDLKHALIDGVYEYIREHRNEYDPGKVDIAAKEATRKKVAYWIDMLGSAGKAA